MKVTRVIEANQFACALDNGVLFNFLNLLYGAAYHAHNRIMKDANAAGSAAPVDLLFVMKAFAQAYDEWRGRASRGSFAESYGEKIGVLAGDVRQILGGMHVEGAREILTIYCLNQRNGVMPPPSPFDEVFALNMMVACLDDHTRFRSCIENRPDDIF